MKRILFDQGTPLPLRKFLIGHEIRTAFKLGWHQLKDSELISAAEEQFDIIITTDRNWKYQQRIANRRIAIILLPSANWPLLQPQVEEIVRTANSVSPGDFVEL